MRIGDWSSDVCSSDLSGKQSFREAALLTHRGLSGPAILQISSYWRKGGSISLDFAPDIDIAAKLKAAKHLRPKAEGRTVLGEILPNRLAQALADALGLNGQLANMPDRLLDDAAERLKSSADRRVGKEWVSRCKSRWS